MSLQVRRASYNLGAEVSGVDLSKPLDEQSFKEIHAAFIEYSVLVFHEQPLTREQHLAFSRRFGTLDRNVAAKPGKKVEEMPEISLVISRPNPDGSAAAGRYSGQEWHTDRSHLPTAALASLLRCIEAAPVGGDTMFANMFYAYDTLTDGMKKLIADLHGVNIEGSAVIDYSSPEREAESRRLNPCAAHPVVRVQPETGRKALYISEQCKILAGMTAEESRPLIKFLSDHALRPQGLYRHRWKKDDLVMWDNRSTLHLALADYDRTQVRHMERTTVNDTTPSGYSYTGPLR